MILRNWRTTAGFCWLSAFVAVASARPSTTTPAFRFDRDTFAFANQTVFEYREGRPYARKKSNQRGDVYNRRCFVLCRTATQFYKFARSWAAPLPENERVVFPGYANLREMSKARGKVLRANIGLGWTVYLRPSNGRIVYQHDPRYQEEMHAELNESLARGQVFVGYLSTFPRITVNHAILVYKRKSLAPDTGIERYAAYDPNHPEAPRELTWSGKTRAFAYQKDVDFVGGFVRVYQVYGKWLQ